MILQKIFLLLWDFSLTEAPGLLAPDPGPFFAAKKGAKKPPAPLCRGLDPEQYEGFTGVFCGAGPGSASPRQGDAPSGQIGGPLTPPDGLLTR